jgi:HK97 family phage major capsid protein
VSLLAPERRTTIDGEIRSSGDGPASVVGYAVKWASINGHRERFQRGAFRDARQNLPIAVQHRDPIGVWTSITEDATGLRVEGRISDTTSGRDASTLLRDGALTGLSIAFIPEESRPERDHTVITRARLSEVSLVMAPSDDDARIVKVRNQETPEMATIAPENAEAATDEPDTTDTIATLTSELAELRSMVTRGNGYRPQDSHTTEDATMGRWLATQVRALTESAGAGSFVVPDQFLTRVWDRLAATAVALRSGMTVLETTSDTLHIPRLTADVAAAWTSEGGVISASDPTMSEIIATPRKLAAITVVSNELIDDSNPGILEIVQTNLVRALALKLDLAAYEGTGTAPEPRGLKNVAGIGSVSLGANGATPTNLDPFADAIGVLAQANADATAVVMHPRSWQTLLKLKEQTAGNNKPLLQESAGAGTSGVQRTLYGVPVYLTSQLSIAETQGTSTDCSSIYAYQADQAIIVRRADIRVEVDRSRLFNSDQSEIRAIGRFDLAIPNPTGIVRILGVRP